MPTSNIKVVLICPLEKVWHAVTDISDYSWRRGLDRSEWQDEKHFVEYEKTGKRTDFTVEKYEACKTWIISYEGEGKKGRRIIKLAGKGSRTVLDMTEIVPKEKDSQAIRSEIRKRQVQYIADLKAWLNCKEAEKVPIL